MVRLLFILLLGCGAAFGQAFTMQDTALLGNASPAASQTCQTWLTTTSAWNDYWTDSRVSQKIEAPSGQVCAVKLVLTGSSVVRTNLYVGLWNNSSGPGPGTNTQYGTYSSTNTVDNANLAASGTADATNWFTFTFETPITVPGAFWVVLENNNCRTYSNTGNPYGGTDYYLVQGTTARTTSDFLVIVQTMQ